MHNTQAMCEGFKCKKGANSEYGQCCCCRILFNELDFINVPSLLSSLCAKNGIPVQFLPKFSPELNPIEQCWGYAKWKYHETPPSLSIDDLVKNALNSLDLVPLESICRSVNEAFLSLTLPDVSSRFRNRSLHYEDSYRKGLNGSQAAWASCKYQSHCTLPADATKEMIEELMRSKNVSQSIM